MNLPAASRAAPTLWATGLSPADYGIWNGKLVNFGGYMTNPYTGNYTGFAPRSTPVYQVNDNVSYLKETTSSISASTLPR